MSATAAGVLAACSQPAAAPTSAPAAAPTTAPAAAASPAAAVSPAASPAAGASPSAAPSAAPAASPAPSPSAAAAVASPSPAASGQFSIANPPPVPAANIASAKPYSGATITYYGDGVGQGNDLDKAAATQFQKDTGITVNVVPRPQSSTDTFSQYQRFFQGQSPDLDVLMIDVIWPGQLASNFVDLGPKLGDASQNHYPGIVANDTINGTLVAMPFFSDFGILYYRTDLLQKYNFSAPPKTWDELTQQATTIMNGEKGSNSTFNGFVFQGAAYEGLTCDAIEWLSSSGGGTIVENGQATLNNPQVVPILNTAKGWVGTIAPRGVTTYMEEDARNTFQQGNSAFMRNWPYAYALGAANDSPVKGKFDVAPLPAGSGQQPVGCIGGWALAASKYSKNPDASVEFIRYLTSPEFQTFRGVVGGYVPTIPSVAADPNVVQAQPYLTKVGNVTRVARPSAETGENYNQVSTYFFQGVNNILNGQDASSVVPTMQNQISRLVSS
ncbi:MAG: ABC transporter substrate-binding protein [Chloroflexi bacterium]|nr:ABC transporter substrate-binding protein [Chloroflexota bacterium]